MLATPLELKVTVVEPSVAPPVDSVAVCPFKVVAALEHGLVALLQAVTVAVDATQARLLVGSESS